jgi:DNA repair exonuclease SbcCD ATPase subunit
MNIEIVKKRLDRLLSQYETAKQNVRQEREALQKAKAEVKAVNEAQQVAQAVAASIQQHAHEQLASVVTRCLEAVFDDAYQFKIDFQRKRGKTEARLYFKRRTLEVDPKTGSGGGVLDVASFALRLTRIMLAQPASRRLLVMDEPMKFLHGEIERARCCELIKKLAEETGFQFIIATGLDWLRVGKVVEIG